MNAIQWHGSAVRGFAARGDMGTFFFARRSRPFARVLALMGVIALVASTQIVPRPPAEAAVAVADVDGVEDEVEAPPAEADLATPGVVSEVEPTQVELATAEEWDVPDVVAASVVAPISHPGPEPHGPDGPTDEVLGITSEPAVPEIKEPAELHLSMVTTASVITRDSVFGAIFTITNHGLGDAEDVHINYDFGDGLLVVRSVHCDNDPFGTDGCELGTIKAGETVQAAVLLWLRADAQGTQSLQVSVSTNDEPATVRTPGTGDEVLSTNTDEDDTGDGGTGDGAGEDDVPAGQDTVVILTPTPTIGVTATPGTHPSGSNPVAELSVVVVADTDVVPANGTVTYTVFVSNAGPGRAVGTTLTIGGNAPAGLTLVETIGCIEDPVGIPECTIGDLPANSTKAIKFTFTAGTNQGPGGFTATVDSDSTDPISLNDDSTVQLQFNALPVANDDTALIAEDAAATPLDVAGNDTDADADPLTVTAIDDAATTGTVTLAGGVVSYDPAGAFDSLAAGATATDTFSYTIDDGVSGTSTATVTITISGVNEAPEATDDTLTTTEDADVTVTKADLISDDTDANGDTVVFGSISTVGTTGAVTTTATSVTYDPDGEFESLGASESDTDTFSYDISDGNGGTDTATVTVTINGVNDTPVAAANTFGVGEDDAAASLNVLGNDSDVDTNDTLTVTAIDDTNTLGNVTLASGVVSYDPDDEFEFLALGDGSGTTFTYTVSDGNGGSDTATVTINVTGVNDAPTAVDDTAVAEAGGAAIDIDVAANDTDVDAFDVPALDAFSAPGIDGTVAIVGGKIRYTPPAAPTVDTFTYTINDSQGVAATGSITVTVSWGPLPPMAFDDAASFDANDASATIPVLDNDTDPNLDTLRVASINTAGTTGAASLSPAGAVSFDPNGAFDSLPAGQSTSTTFTYVVTDDDAGTADDTGTVTITVTGVNDAPTTTADTYTVSEDDGSTPLNITANDGDVDTGDTLTVISAGAGATGTVSLNAGTVSYDPGTAFQLLGTGATAIDTFTYTVSDGSGATATGSVTVTINGVNDAPDAPDTSVTFGEDGPGATVAVAPTDPDSDPITITTGGSPTGSVSLVNGDISYDPNGQFEALAIGETATDSFTYTATDGNGGSDTGTVTVTVNGVNDPVVAVDDPFDVDENVAAPITLDVLGNDTDADTNDTLTVTGYSGNAGTVTNTNSTLTYLPDHAAAQALAAGDTLSDTFSYTVSDGTVNDTATITITINGQNDPPVTVADMLTVDEDATGTVDVIANDAAGETGDTVTLDSVAVGAIGAATKLSTTDIQYIASGWDHLDDGDTADEDVTYVAIDGFGATTNGTLTVTINGKNDAPIAIDDAATGVTNGPQITIDVLDNDSDADASDTLEITGVVLSTLPAQPTQGLVTFTSAEVKYTPHATFVGTDTFTYTISDGDVSSTATVSVEVAPEADLEVTVSDDADPIVAGQDVTYTVTVKNNGPSPATNVTGAYTLPTGTALVGASALGLGTIADGNSQVFTVSVTADLSPTGSTITFQPSASATETDPDASNNTGSETTGVTATPNADLEIVSVVDSDDPILPLAPNNTTTYTVTVKNNGPDTATAVTATNTYSTDVPFNPAGGGSCVAPGITCPLGNLVSGQTASYTVGAAATATASGSEAFAVSVTSSTHDFTPANNAANTTTNVIPPPTATADSYTSIGNVGITVPAASGVLANDTGANLAVTAAQGATTNGGAFSIAAGGGFTYNAPAAAVGTDSFTYTVTNSSGSATGTVTITLTGKIWFVDGAAAAGGDGTFDGPFNTVPASIGANGDTIFVKTSTTGGIALGPQQKLIGAGSTTTLAAEAGVTVPTFSFTLPTTGGARPTVTATSGTTTVGLSANNTVRGLDVRATAGSAAIAETVPANDPGIITILEASAIAADQAAVTASGGTQNITLDEVGAGGTADGVQLTGSAGGVIDLSNLSITVSSAAAIKIDGLATVNVTGATNTVSVTNPLTSAVDIAALIGPNGVSFEKIDSTGGPTAIKLTGTGTGAFTVTGIGTTDSSGGTVQNTAADAVILTNVNGPVTLKNMAFTNIGNMSTAGISGHDVVHVENMTGKLTLDNVDVDGVSDNFVHGVAGQPFSGGVEVANSTIQNTNRFATGVADDGDDSEGAIWASGISGIVTVRGNIFNNTNQSIYVQPSAMPMTLSVDNNAFLVSDPGGAAARGQHCIKVTPTSGSHTVNIGSSTGNIFNNCRTRSLLLEGNGGAVSGSFSNNVVVVTNHNDGGTPGVDNWASGNVELNAFLSGFGSFTVSGNQFGKDPVGGLAGNPIRGTAFDVPAGEQWLSGLAMLDIIPDAGSSNIMVQANTFWGSFDSMWQVRGSGAGTVTFSGNQYNTQRLTDRIAAEFNVPGWDGPGRPYCIAARAGANLTVGVTNESLAGHELDAEAYLFGNSLQIVEQAGGTLTASISGVTIVPPQGSNASDDISVFAGVGGTQTGSGSTAIVNEPAGASTDCNVAAQ